MAVLSSPSANVDATVDSTVKALRVIDYGNAGNKINTNASNAYYVTLSQSFNTGTYAAAPAYPFWLTNPIGSGINIYVREINAYLLSDPAAAAASQQEIVILKSIGFSSQASGGYQIKLNQSMSSSAAGTIIGGAAPSTKYSEIAIIEVLRSGRQYNSRASVQLKFGSARSRNNVLVLQPGEALVFKMNVATIAASGIDSIGGYILWEERS